ncbi:GNAT family N-acetyltransferase [Pseudoalteromonas luteoviolacea]|uniref:N-acetyltransferase domain-containing protein n=1 Tax=Pseudoalteromonas luteoviolacea S4060-1 TaxID=1365257 RepID=A0A162BFM7_9GAMM|nr:GNAT family N-acetyltransferase [Pseudoalteromonas luteoviolacea]KZN61347.1 hypothetical protein N478_04585 [Pseudoalteromonas luteoviolacea S4060-1]
MSCFSFHADNKRLFSFDHLRYQVPIAETNKTMKIRTLTNQDWPAIFDIYAKSKLDELQNESQNIKLVPLEHDIHRLTELEESDVYICENGEIMGFGAIFKHEIRALFVHPNYRGCGVGQTLLEKLLSLGKRPISLNVANSNSPAINLYVKYGFSFERAFHANYHGIIVEASRMTKHLS